jgi:hypothetical protein
MEVPLVYSFNCSFDIDIIKIASLNYIIIIHERLD